ncbi:hypothetical protein HKX48_006686 [Thoreauomyces humboldtii]|nr:hypothetical protein HKX48_006686 [Thoreauomyces humboldtii]
MTVDVPDITSEWDTSSTITLAFSSTGEHLWGEFEFGDYAGYIRSRSDVPKEAGKEVKFTWRSSDAGEGYNAFSDGNTLGLTFFTDEAGVQGGLVSGWIEGDSFGGSAIVGRLVERWDGDVRFWKDCYREMNYDFCKSEHRERWGPNWNRGREFPAPRPDNPEWSDTSVGDSRSGYDVLLLTVLLTYVLATAKETLKAEPAISH